MAPFSILTTRKRAVIALVHTLIFLALTVWQAAMPRTALALKLHSHNSSSASTMIVIYGVVTAVLLALLCFSRRGMERLYFVCCASSASLGLMRSVFGDPPLHVAQYMRIAMLVCAAVVGTMILRMHAEVLVAE